MAYNTTYDAANNADFIVDISATDIETGDDIDFTGAAVSISIKQNECTPLITASIGNGITQPTAFVLELTITAAQMATLRPGSYRIGAVYLLGGVRTSLFVGDFVVYDGAASV